MSSTARTRRRPWWIALGAVPVLILLVLLARDGDREARRTVSVMGTVATVRVWASTGDEARRGVDAAIRELERMEALLSSWDPDSEVGRINALPPDSSRAVAPELMALLEEAREWTRRTGGAFEPVVGALVDVWDLRGDGRRPEPSEIASALTAVGSGGIRLEPDEGRVIRLDERAWIDAGAFGKGAALRTTADTLRTLGVSRAHVDLGGQILVLGREPVALGVAHPAVRNEVVATLRVSDGSVATSGQSERGVEVEGRRMGHIVDPRSGRPVPAWGSVTVTAHDAMVADLLATALFVLGPEEGMDLARSLVGVGVLFLEDDEDGLRASFNETMSGHLDELPDGVSEAP